MEEVISLIKHLLTTRYSIDSVDSIVKHLKISKNHLLQLINEESYKEYFQLLHPSNNYHQGVEKIALTLDLFCCTHYAQHCKNQSCSFLHLCPYNIRPMFTKCTNKTCPYDHDILQSSHNRKIIDARGLNFIPTITLYEIIRASADPIRTFWVCTDHGKKSGCSKKSHCDKLHYCYYALIDACTKPYCSHTINDACLAYFRQKDLIEQDQDDILNAFKKVLRQRKPDYVNTGNMSYHTLSSSSSPKISNSGHNQRKSSNNKQHRTSSSSRKSTPIEITSARSTCDDILSTKSDSSPPLPDHEQDILLEDSYDRYDYVQTERYLSDELGFPIKLLTLKSILSQNKETECASRRSKPIYYYYPIRDPAEIFRTLRWQNEDKRLIKPLIVYANVRDAHDAAKQNFENNQFCIFRIHLFHSGVINGDLLPENRLQLKDPSKMCFDRMWIYIFNL
ncbi:unnamed protein product [Adineta steineri]|uniref:Uncharacterized protein n=1 Tax=Adineta steineri TaxID=433720 RepID=A0A814ZI96_9BILA|nr:unnamed protein product [Adineta steineri]CAF3996424.1 unnamed protein product [Adineta steineri]